MALAQPNTEDYEAALAEKVLQYVHDPLGFVYFAFPWGEPGTLLAQEEGPDTWQIDILETIGSHLRSSEEALRIAVASGHGIGKSTLVAWLILWFLSTKPNPQSKVTAGTKDQLEKHTWRELSKWHKLAVNTHWFEWTATKFYLKAHPETWFASAIPWTKDRPQSFAGMHEDYVMTVYDEASTIDDAVWEVSEGAMSTPGAIWLAFGNPEKNTGRFRECFPGRRFAHRWMTRQIDSRTAKKTDKAEIAKQIQDYGEDSDFVRVRWLGIFPRAASTQFIGDDLIRTAGQRFRDGVPIDPTWPKILGVDVARFGDDKTVLLMRQGPKILWKRDFRGIDTMQTASMVAESIQADDPDTVFVDVVGVGAGVVDRLHQIGHRRKVIGVNAAQLATDVKKYHNLRAEMWDKCKKWLVEWGEIDPQERTLCADLTGVEYGYDAKERIQLERKEDMKKRGLASPDEADALCLTFAMPVARRPEPEPEQRFIEIGIGTYEGAWMA